MAIADCDLKPPLPVPMQSLPADFQTITAGKTSSSRIQRRLRFFLSFSKCMNTENYYFFPPQNTQYGLQNNYFYSLRICKKLYLCCYWNSYPCVAVFLCLTLLYCFIGTLRIIPGSDSKKTQRPPLIFREKRHGLLRFKSHVFLPDIAYLPHFVCINTSQQPTLRERSDQSITTAESSRS